jgi:hypothetical protein
VPVVVPKNPAVSTPTNNGSAQVPRIDARRVKEAGGIRISRVNK